MSKIKKQKNNGGCTPRILPNTSTNLFQGENRETLMRELLGLMHTNPLAPEFPFKF